MVETLQMIILNTFFNENITQSQEDVRLEFPNHDEI